MHKIVEPRYRVSITLTDNMSGEDEYFGCTTDNTNELMEKIVKAKEYIEINFMPNL
jgi:hypothetical protein